MNMLKKEIEKDVIVVNNIKLNSNLNPEIYETHLKDEKSSSKMIKSSGLLKKTNTLNDPLSQKMKIPIFKILKKGNFNFKNHILQNVNIEPTSSISLSEHSSEHSNGKLPLTSDKNKVFAS